MKGETPVARDGYWIALAALVARLAVAVWGARRFPPAEDGHYYHVVAQRIADGHGYTWLWPDGAVTYAAHYPIGYPALVGALYSVFGPHAVAAMVFHAVLGAAAVLAVHRIAATVASRRGAVLAAFAAALHPALVLYTPALMTEGVVASCLALCGWVAVVGRERQGLRWLLVLGATLGVTTLIRPQSLVLAPLFGWASATSSASIRRRLFAAVSVTALAAAVCLPWTARNCERMGRCVFVSANGGWNLLIGSAPHADGAWVPIERVGFPEECRTVFGEADKDACFARAAREHIVRETGRWLSLVPRKLSATFDYGGAPGWYLHASNPALFGTRAKVALGIIETVWQRALVLSCLAALAAWPGPRRRARAAVAVLGALFALQKAVWVSYAAFVAQALLLGNALGACPPALLAAAAVGATAAVHAVFFGSGRYSLVAYPLLAAAAGLVLTPWRGPGDTRDKETSDAAD